MKTAPKARRGESAQIDTMRKPEPTYASIRVSALLLGLWAVLAPAGAHELKDLSIHSAAGQAILSLSFSPGQSEGEYPLYFQKADPAKGTVLISFLETETSFPLGRHAPDGDNPDIEEILLKKITSPSGKSFLGVEIKPKRPLAGDFPIDAAPKNVLKVGLGGGGNGKYAWSLSKSLNAGDANLPAKTDIPAPAKASEAGKTIAAAPAAAEVRKAASAPAAGRAMLTEVKWVATAGAEDLILAFDPPSAPEYVPGSGGKDSSWLELTFAGAASGLARKEYSLRGSPVYKRFTVAEKKGGLLVRIQLATREPVRILPHAVGLSLSGPGRGDAAQAFAWTSARPDILPAPAASVSEETFPSAHEAGLAIESRKAGKGAGLSSGKIFSLTDAGKTMVLLKDSVALRTRPGADGKSIRKIPIGEAVMRIGSKGAHQRVVSGADTGYLRSADLVYEDELTEAQGKAIRGLIEAKLAKIAAAAAREEEKARKAAAALAAAEDAARKKAELAEAAAVAAAEKQALLAAQAAQAAAAAKEAAPAIGTSSSNPGAGTGSQSGPKLAIADNPELAAKLAQEKLAAEEEKKRIEPESNRIAYNSYGRRDPFIPVDQGGADNGIDIDQMKVVGIIWQSEQPMAILEHNREAGVSFTIKEGDPVHNGRVARISRDGVSFDISEYGISRSYSLKLVSSKEGTKK